MKQTDRLSSHLWPVPAQRLNWANLWLWIKADPRWPVAFVLLSYLVLGMTILGFNRTPGQILMTTFMAAGLEMALAYGFRRKIFFPLSAIITSFGLSILLNYSHSYTVLALPVFFAIAGKYVFTFNDRHIYNPGLLGIVLSLLFSESLITASPAYQWNGITAMSALIVLPALLLFMPRIRRTTIVVTFLVVFTIQTALRAWIMKHHLPFETLFFGTLSSPSFFLFVFFMLTDPATSPASQKQQIIAGTAIAIIDLIFHIGQSYFTFFYAAFVYASFRASLNHWQSWRLSHRTFVDYFKEKVFSSGYFWRPLILLPLGFFLVFIIVPDTDSLAYKEKPTFTFVEHDVTQNGIEADLGTLYEQVDPRIHHVIKWIFSVGDAVAVGDYDGDGLEDVFLTLVLKEKHQRAALYRNLGDFQFERIPLPALDEFIAAPKSHGVATNAVFADYDNDGDQDILLTVAFGHPRLLRNTLKESGVATFVDVSHETGLDKLYTNSITATFTDINVDGHLDLLIGNVIPKYLPGYDEKSPKLLNLFNLPEPEYEGDRRMFNFMHHSWHEANNGGKNILLLATGDGSFEIQDSDAWGLGATRWSLAVSAADFNNDSYPDLYIANDFGADSFLINNKGQSFRSVKGDLFGSIGRDTYKGMNASVGDVNRDGFLDVYVSNVHHHLQAEGSMLWLSTLTKNSSVPQMSDQATYFGLLNERRFGWGASMVDLDHNGWLDILQANGMVDDTIDKKYESCPDYWYVNEKIARSPPSYHTYADRWGDIRGMCIYGQERNRVYINRGGKAKPQFVDVAVRVGATKKTTSRGVAAVDLNNNGRSDVMFTHMFHPPTLYENKSTGDSDTQWLGITLVGDKTQHCNRDALGSKMKLSYRDSDGSVHSQYHELQAVSGLLGQNSRRIVFGLGEGPVDKLLLKIKWCGKDKWQEFNRLQLNSYNFFKQSPKSSIN